MFLYAPPGGVKHGEKNFPETSLSGTWQAKHFSLSYFAVITSVHRETHGFWEELFQTPPKEGGCVPKSSRNSPARRPSPPSGCWDCRQKSTTPPLLLPNRKPAHVLARPTGVGRTLPASTRRSCRAAKPFLGIRPLWAKRDAPTELAEGEKLHFAPGQPRRSPFGWAAEVKSVVKRHSVAGGRCFWVA